MSKIFFSDTDKPRVVIRDTKAERKEAERKEKEEKTEQHKETQGLVELLVPETNTKNPVV